MFEPIHITIHTEPVAKARPRLVFNVVNGKMKVRAYTPPKTAEAEEFLKDYFQQFSSKMIPAYVPVKLTAVFYRRRSKWSPKADKLPVRKPDIDNFQKCLLDGMNGLLVADDAQITDVCISKRWSATGRGYIDLTIEEIDK
jgi:Holliday junction resolvase RusA-like endonuclease